MTVRVHEYVPRVMHVDVPDHSYAAKFSVPYCIAAALHDGRVDLATFDSLDASVLALARRVRYEVHPELRGEEMFMARESTELEIETDRGTFSKLVNRMQNRGTGAHLRPEDPRSKLADCLRHSETGLDGAAEWGRLHRIDSDAAWDLWAMAPVEALR